MNVEQKAFLFSGSESWNNTKELNAMLAEGFIVVEITETQVVNNKLTTLIILEREIPYEDSCDCEEEAAE